MNALQAGLLGIIQGATEFLPVSSSGHLVIFQKLIPGFSQPGILFDVFLHFGTVLAVIIFYFKRILKLNFKYIEILIIASIPAAILGFLLKDAIDIIFQSTKFVGAALLVTGVMNFFTGRRKEGDKNIKEKNGLIIGIFQALAIFPGISRSGATIFAGTGLGIKKENVVEFSLLLSIPAVLGANLLEISKIINTYNLNFNYIVGFICSFIVGLMSIKILLNLLIKNKFKYLGYYCFVLGLFVLLLM